MAINQITAAVRQRGLAAAALAQLYQSCVYPKAAITSYEEAAFNLDDNVDIRRMVITEAEEFDPRTAPLDVAEEEYITGTVTLEKQFGKGYTHYKNAPGTSLRLYTRDIAAGIADSINRPNERYMYSAFRNWQATTGIVRLGIHPPFKIVASTTNTGGLDAYSSELHRHAKAALKADEAREGEIYAVLSTTAGSDFLGDATNLNNYVSAAIAGQTGGASLLQNGMRTGQWIDRYGIMTTDSTAVGDQSAVADLDTGGTGDELPISAVELDTQFLVGDRSPDTPIGAVKLTLTVSGAFTSDVAVGAIARLGASGGATLAYGVILRVDAVNDTVTLIPYAPNGRLVKPAQILTGTHVFSIPDIPSVNTIYDRRALLMAVRPTIAPSEESNVVMTNIFDRELGLGIQFYSGQFEIQRLREISAVTFLTGTKFVDCRRGVLALSV